MGVDQPSEALESARRVPGGVQAVERTFNLLEMLVGSKGALSASEMGRASALPYSTVHRLLGGLVGRGYASQDPETRTYTVGPRMIALGSQFAPMLGDWSRPLLHNLVNSIGETASLAIMQDEMVLYVEQVQSRRKLRTFAAVGNRVFAHSSAVGKVLLAARKPAVVETLIRRHGLPKRTANTITNPTDLFTELDRVRRSGFAIDDGEEDVGVRCVAVPVQIMGKTVAAVSISGPGTRVTPARQEGFAAQMIAEVSSLTMLLEDAPSDDTTQRIAVGARTDDVSIPASRRS